MSPTPWDRAAIERVTAARVRGRCPRARRRIAATRARTGRNLASALMRDLAPMGALDRARRHARRRRAQAGRPTVTNAAPRRRRGRARNERPSEAPRRELRPKAATCAMTMIGLMNASRARRCSAAPPQPDRLMTTARTASQRMVRTGV